MPESLGDYQLTSLLGEGGLSRVYHATKANTQTHYAVKILKPETRMHWAKELNFADNLSHDYIVKFIQAAEIGKYSFFVFELGSSNINPATNGNVKFSEASAEKALHDIATALDYIHSKDLDDPFIHRDVKPDNIIYFKQLDKFKLCDFGVTEQASKLYSIPYTIIPHAWFFPAAINDLNKANEQSDLYQLGLSILTMLGSPILAGTDKSAIYSQINNGYYEHNAASLSWRNQALGELVCSLLSVNPLKRPKSAKQVLQRLALTHK